MADHDVRFSANNIRVAGIDFSFDVKIDDEVRGTLSVSEGGLSWRPKYAAKKKGVPISWTEFAGWAES